MDVEHLNQMAHHVVIVELLVQLVEFHQEVEHVDNVQKNLQNQGVVLHAAVVLQELDASRNDVVILLVRLHENIVVELLHNEQDYLHEVEEAEVLLSLFVRQQNELHDVFQIVFVRYLLNVLKMRQDFHELVPDGVGKVLCILDVIDFQKLQGHFPVDLLQIFGD